MRESRPAPPHAVQRARFPLAELMSGRESARPPAVPDHDRFIRKQANLPLDTAQIGAQIARVILAEFDLRHVRMACRNAALEHARQLVEIDPLAERAQRQREQAAATDVDG